MSFINNIQSVAKYESKILIRSWFFKVFMVLAILILGFFDFGMLVADDGGGMWMLKALPSNLPYVNLLLLNTGQAVICIFLASEFLKRDKKLDTSEVFYVRPLSNAEYVIGKIWGNLRVFLILNLIVMGMALIFNLFGNGGRLGSVSSVFLSDKHPDTGFHYRSVYFPDAGVEEPGAYLYYLTGIYRADIVLYQ